MIGVDFAGPVKYRNKCKEERKVYVVLYPCGLTRGVFLEVLTSLETGEFLTSLKHFIARRVGPSRVYSDSGQTFVTAAKWLKKARDDEKLHAFLSNHSIIWQFNLSRAPWWGGQFESLIGLMKAAFYKTVGQGLLSWGGVKRRYPGHRSDDEQPSAVVLEEDVQFPTQTPNRMLFLDSNILPELQPYQLEERDLRMHAKVLQKTKDAMWSRWTAEYLRALRERHGLKHGDKKCSLAVGYVIIIKSSERNRNSWPLAIVGRLIEGRDGAVRGARLRTGRSHIERPIQHLYPLELSCDREDDRRNATTLHPGATVFRPRRDAAVAARFRVRDLAQEDQLE